MDPGEGRGGEGKELLQRNSLAGERLGAHRQRFGQP